MHSHRLSVYLLHIIPRVQDPNYSEFKKVYKTYLPNKLEQFLYSLFKMTFDVSSFLKISKDDYV